MLRKKGVAHMADPQGFPQKGDKLRVASSHRKKQSINVMSSHHFTAYAN